jgi:aromatic-L-amino-acid decarboxylase
VVVEPVGAKLVALEKLEFIFYVLKTLICTQNTHWHHPHFFAYFPTANSYPSIIGDILSTGMGNIGFTWVRSN